MVFCISCGKRKDEVRYLHVQNHSENEITLKFSSDFPDTAFALRNLRLIGSIEAGDDGSYVSKLGWDNLAKANSTSTLSFFVFDSGIFSQYPDSTIEQNYMVLERRDLSLDELEVLNWTITYP